MSSAASARAEAIEGFAAVLAELRSSVGSPSFRAMAGRSRAISHTTLHEAVQGNRLPSWGTTAEFVKACGADPRDFRARWEAATRAVCAVAETAGAPHLAADLADLPGLVGPAGLADPPGPTSATAPADQLGPVPPGAPPDASTPSLEESPDTAGSAPGGRRWLALTGALTALMLCVGAVTAWTTSRDQGSPPDPAADPAPQYAAGDCPVQQPNPPKAPPAHDGDHAALVADVTYPDCDHARAGQVIEKVWRIKNAGSVPWSGYALHRLDQPQRRDQCQTIADVPIPDTAPGQQVDVRVAVTVPSTPGFCFVRFKMVDAAGDVAFPGSRPINFQVVVDE